MMHTLVIAGEGDAPTVAESKEAVQDLRRWAERTNRPALAESCRRFAQLSRSGASRVLRGPTGKDNIYMLLPREAVLCLADDEVDRLVRLAATLAVGSQAIWPIHGELLRTTLPARGGSESFWPKTGQLPL